jgi:alkylation response protein AidB-like acyl-CoA dehydrogenase
MSKPLPSVQTHRPTPNDFLSGDALESLSAEEVIRKTGALEPKLLDAASMAESQRRPVDALWDDIRASGYFYMWVPKKFGGLEATVDEVVDATLPIARGCASTAWVSLFGLVHNRHMVGFPEAFQEELFSDGKYGIIASATIPIGQAEPCKGGYRLSGRWKWATCVTQADWVLVVAQATVDGETAVGSFMIPSKELVIIDTWDTAGMRATGTHDVEGHDIFVPEHRANLVTSRGGGGRGAELYDNPIYRVPLSPLLAFTTAVPLVGAAQAAVQFYRERLMVHVKRGTSGSQSDKPNSQIRLAQAETMVAIAEQTVRNVMKDNLAVVQNPPEDEVAFRSRLRAQMSYAAKLCREAVILVCESSGTSIHFSANPIQRILRDLMVMTSHVIFDFDVTMEQHGRGMLGLEPNTTIT